MFSQIMNSFIASREKTGGSGSGPLRPAQGSSQTTQNGPGSHVTNTNQPANQSAGPKSPIGTNNIRPAAKANVEKMSSDVKVPAPGQGKKKC